MKEKRSMNKVFKKIRSILRYSFLSICGSIKTPSPCIHILNGHGLRNNAKDKDKFRELLKNLSKTSQLVDFNDAVSMIKSQVKVDRPHIAFTFDDGFSECYEVFAPILEEFGIRACFFINPNYASGDRQYIINFNTNNVHNPGKLPMTWKQIEELSNRGHIIGAHTLDHVMINNGDLNWVKHQIEDCKEIIQEHTGKPCEYFAFPYGRLDHASTESIQIACKKYRYVFSQSDYENYFSFGGSVLNRRHFEPDWPISHVMYFLSVNRK